MPEVMDQVTKSERTPAATTPPPRRSPVKFILMGMLLVGIVAGGWAYYHFRDRVSTDDAQVDAHVVAIAPKISGMSWRCW